MMKVATSRQKIENSERYSSSVMSGLPAFYEHTTTATYEPINNDSNKITGMRVLLRSKQENDREVVEMWVAPDR